MPSRLANPLPEPPKKRLVGLRQRTTLVNDASELTVSSGGLPTRTLSPVSGAAMNTLQIITNTENNTGRQSHPPGSIEETESKEVDTHTAVSSRINSSHILSPRTSPLPVTPSIRNISAEFGALRSYSNFSIAEDSTASNNSSSPQQWSSAVGKANLGKSGRVIEKLMAENDMLKRDLQISKLALDESKQDVKMVEARMEALSADFESKIHDAVVTKALLKKRDRQVADLKAQIEVEQQKAKTALERERNWRSAMEKMEMETKQEIDEANSYAALMEGRNNTLTSHWKEQSALVDATVAKLKVEIKAIAKDRQNDIRRMDLLEELIEQKDVALANFEMQKDGMSAIFEAYKAEQESQLSDIKTRAEAQGKRNDELEEEAQSVLGELRWAIAVRRDMRGAR